MSKRVGKKRWNNMSCDEQRGEFLRRLAVMIRSTRDMGQDDAFNLFAAAMLVEQKPRAASVAIAGRNGGMT